jgi:hypothetical protein
MEILAERCEGQRAPKCQHDWQYAGPTKRLSVILDGIEGVSYYVSDKTSRLHVKVGEETVYQPYEYQLYHSSRSTWRDSILQGKVCIKCGECEDIIAEQIKWWMKKVHDKQKAIIAKQERKLLAQKLWHDCEFTTK